MATPGVKFLVSSSPLIVSPFAGAISIRFLLQRFYDLAVSIPTVLVTTAAVLPVLFVLSRILSKISEERRAEALGAQPLPIWSSKWPGAIDRIGFLLHMTKGGYAGEGMGELFEEHGGTFNMRMLGSNQVATADPDHIKAVLNTEFNNFEKGPRLSDIVECLFGRGIFNVDGEEWKQHRTMTRPFFNKELVEELEWLDSFCDGVIGQIKTRMNEGQAIDIQDLMNRFTMDSSMTFLFGTSVKSLKTIPPYAHNVPASLSTTRQSSASEIFSEAFFQAQAAANQRSHLGPLWPLTELFKDKTTKHVKVVFDFIEPLVSEAVEKHQAEVAGEKKKIVEERETLLEYLVKHTEDPKVLRDETLNILIASRDSTAATLTFLCLMLSEHPHMMERLRKEILDTIGDRRPTYDDLRSMKYLHAHIKEVLRLYPPVPRNFRQTIGEAILKPTTPGGKPLYVPPKTIVTYSPLHMHRRKDLWGPDADDYDPDRWLDERYQKYFVPKPHIYVPFNAGPRICLGQQFATNQAAFMMCRLLQNFDKIDFDGDAQPPWSRPPAEWKTRPGRERVEKVRPKVLITLFAMGGVWVRMREAKDVAT